MSQFWCSTASLKPLPESLNPESLSSVIISKDSHALLTRKALNPVAGLSPRRFLAPAAGGRRPRVLELNCALAGAVVEIGQAS